MTSLTPTASSTVGSPDTDRPAGSSRGKTVIDDAVVAKIAGLAVREVAGVHAVGGSAARALGAIREALSSVDHSQGISVEVNEGQVAVELTIVAEYPEPLQKVADDVRSAIIEAIETLAGLEVTEVTVTVKDVHLAEEVDETDDTATAAETDAP